MAFDQVWGAWDNFQFKDDMALKQKRAVLVAGIGLAASGTMAGFCSPTIAQTTFAAAGRAQAPENSAQSGGETQATTSSRADAYFNYTMGHIAEQQYEATSRGEYATQAIEYYKKAYALDPKSPVIGERLAEMYWKAQRVREAETEAQELLKRDPNDAQTRRLLGHIYLRSLGEANGSGQTETVTRAAEQFKEVVRLDPADTESALWLARLYRLQNKHEQAEEVLRGILKSDPDNEAGVEQLTQLLLDQGKSAEAVALLEGITSKSPSPTLLDLLGDAYTQTKDLAKAEAAYRKATELDPSELSHQRGLGQALLSEEKYPEALKVYQKLSDLMPDDSDVYLRIAQIYRELHQLDKAEETLTKARQYAPGSLDVMYNEAMLYQAQGRNEDAIRVLSEAVKGVKGQSEVLPTRRRTLAVLYQQLGQLYRTTENFQGAVFTYEELGRLGGDEDRRARLLLMETYRGAKELPKALQTGKEALAKYPTDSSIRSSHALLLGEAAHTEEALALLKPQLKGTDADREVYLNIAQVYERGRRYKEAEQAARTAEALPGAPRENEMTWFLLGAIYERQKFYDRAEVEFKKVLAVDPQNAAALNYYGYMLGDLGIRLDEAEAMVKKALADDAYNGAYLDSLGWIYFRQGKLAEAEATLRKAVERESHDPTIHSHLGDVYAKTGRMEMAAMQWDKSLEEWRRVLPADVENDKIAEVEKKVNQSKHRVAQKAAPTGAQPK
ncbi:MAG TPA: tetratricopeptide repeat protein [Candidatus Sulfotelmatobacter sp.]|jgi:tetratricopeptide (TPR) repeat protein|nr:tetratricopeptide repeat protein [Candidatus Sulfotelmatobacter sp.]